MKLSPIYIFIILIGLSTNVFGQNKGGIKKLTPKKIVKTEAESNSVSDTTKRDTTRNTDIVFDAPVLDNPDMLDVSIKGKMYKAMITEEGDTLILANLDDVSITSFRTFADAAEQRKYNKFRRYAAKVFPYAKEAIRIFREVEYADEHLSRRAKKRELKRLEEELKAEFEEPLSKLTKLQGKIMLKMIEKEIGSPTYDLLKEVKGGFRAFYWHQFSRLYGYDLKEGYQPGKYKILDAVLQDFDLGYRIDNDTNLKYIHIDDLRK